MKSNNLAQIREELEKEVQSIEGTIYTITHKELKSKKDFHKDFEMVTDLQESLIPLKAKLSLLLEVEKMIKEKINIFCTQEKSCCFKDAETNTQVLDYLISANDLREELGISDNLEGAKA